jgi:hypothetical protein
MRFQSVRILSLLLLLACSALVGAESGAPRSYALKIASAYGDWSIAGVEGRFRGEQAIPLIDGSYLVKGTQGWRFTLPREFHQGNFL